MTFARAIGKPRLEQAQMQHRMRAVGCIACLMREVNGIAMPLHTPAELHHLVRSGMQLGQDFVVPLCQWHHRAQPFGEFLDAQACRYHLGPSLAEGSRAFHARFGSNQALLSFARATAGLCSAAIPPRAMRKPKGSARTPNKIIRRTA